MRWIGVMLDAASGLSAGALCLLLGGEAAMAVLAVTAAGVADMLREPAARREGAAQRRARQQADAGFETITSFG